MADPPPSEARLTVAIPSYNGASHLAECLGSVLAQQGATFRLIVSDDQSTDETVDIVRATAGARADVLINPARLGLAGNWNRCVELADTPFVTVFHQDDVMMPGHLAAHQAAFERDETVGLVASASAVIDEHGHPVSETVVGRGGLGPADRVLPAGALAREMTTGNPLRCSAVTMRRVAFDEAGGFDRSLRYVLDWDFWLRVSRRWAVTWLARPTVQVRWHAASETHRFKSGTADLDETVDMLELLFGIDLKDDPAVRLLRHTAEGRLARAFINRAHDALKAGDAELGRSALRRGLRLSPAQLGTILRDPRLALAMGALTLSPGLAARWFGPDSGGQRADRRESGA